MLQKNIVRQEQRKRDIRRSKRDEKRKENEKETARGGEMDDRRRKWVVERKRIGEGDGSRGRAGVIGKNKEKDTLCLSTTRQQL